MKAKLINVAAAGVFALAAGVATAADDVYRGSWYVVPGVSLLNADSDLQSKRTAPAVSLRLSRELSPNWDVQLGGSYGRADSKDSYAGQALSGHYKQTLLGVDALYLFNHNKLRPFLLAGLGYARNDVDYTYAGVPVDGTKNSWMANAGVGLQYYFTDNIGLQADVRHVWSRARGIAAGTGFTDSGTIGNNYLNLGVIFKFGAPKKMAAAAPVAASSPVMEPPQQAPAEPQQSPAKQIGRAHV
jgi:OmpA-OmpF porin, OOP family